MLTNLLTANFDHEEFSSLEDFITEVLNIATILCNLALGEKVCWNLALHHLTTLVLGLVEGLSSQ
jgi:hypothetical protein